MDVQAQLSHLSPEARAALARRIKSRLVDSGDVQSEHDVAIAGGGAAALTLALELRHARPTMRVVVVEPREHPLPEITHTVGESTVEISAQYLRDRLGLADHLNTAQIRKMGLRMFFTHDGNADITRRLELGSSSFTPQVTYQIDRGRLENELTRRCESEGIEILAGRVTFVDFGHGGHPHRLSIQRRTETTTTTARWVVDASGRNRALSRQLELKRTNNHHCNAVWLRVATEIDIGRWSDDPSWQARLREGDRALSTNHLMGEGYWVWLIRLASGSTSVGIVADPAFHPFSEFNTLEKAQAWLAEHEPQCAAILDQSKHLIQDFRVMKKYSHGSTKVYDAQSRWCLTGDAAVFLDPLYSSGLDLVAIGNGLITDMITRELDGEDVVGRASINDSLFRSLADMWLNIYCNQYKLMGTPAVMTAKVIWDVAFYWGFLGMMYSNDRFASVADDPGVVPHLEGLIELSNRMQQFFREWAGVETAHHSEQFVDLYSAHNFMVKLHTAMMGRSADFTAEFDANILLLRQLAGQLIETILTDKCRLFTDEVMRQVQAWQRDTYLRQLRSTYRHEDDSEPLSQKWIVRDAPQLEFT